MTPNRLESLYRKRFKFPGDFSAADQLELEMCEQVAYTEKVNHMSTPQSNNMSQMSSDSGSTSSQSSSKSIISPYGECIATNRDIKREWSGIHLEDIAPLLDQSKSHFQSTANFHATFINFISETVRQDDMASEKDAIQVQTYITDMFWVYKDKEVRDAVRSKTRHDWLSFLGEASKIFFNPVFPKFSGSDTNMIREAFCSKLRNFIFGQHAILKYRSIPGTLPVVIHLPNPKAILSDLNTKFLNRHKTEHKLLNRLRIQHEEMALLHRADLLAGRTDAVFETVHESPRRESSAKGGVGSRGIGRPRKTESQWMLGNAVTILGKRGVKHHVMVAAKDKGSSDNKKSKSSSKSTYRDSDDYDVEHGNSDPHNDDVDDVDDDDDDIISRPSDDGSGSDIERDNFTDSDGEIDENAYDETAEGQCNNVTVSEEQLDKEAAEKEALKKPKKKTGISKEQVHSFTDEYRPAPRASTKAQTTKRKV